MTIKKWFEQREKKTSKKEEQSKFSEQYGLQRVIRKQNKQTKNHSTQDSRVVPHRGTNQAALWLTAQIRRDAVLSESYGRGYWYSIELAYIPIVASLFQYNPGLKQKNAWGIQHEIMSSDFFKAL